MDSIIATICRDAEQKLALHTAEIQTALKQSKEEIAVLKAENTSLKNYIRQVEVNLQQVREGPGFRDADLWQAGDTMPEGNGAERSRMLASLATIESIKTALQDTSAMQARGIKRKDSLMLDSLEPSTRRTLAGGQTSTHNTDRPQTPTTLEDKGAIEHKYNMLKDYCLTLQAKYRKEKSIWKQWIAHIEREEDLPSLTRSHSTSATNALLERVADRHDAGDLVLADRNCNEVPIRSSQTEASVQDTKESKLPREVHDSRQNSINVATAVPTLLTDSVHVDKQVKAEPMSDAALPPSSSQEAHSLDLDQTTIRKPIDRLRALRDLSDDENTTPTRSRVLNNVKKGSIAATGIHAVLEDEIVLGEQELQHEAGKLLEDLLSSPPAVIPGTRKTIKREDEINDRNLKRTHSESSASTQESARRNATRRRALRSKTELNGPQSTSDYVINKARNNGLGHAFHEVVRGKEARSRLHADDCPCCSKFYQMAGPAPPGLAPVWRSPPGKGAAGLDREEGTTTRQQVGRHRTTWRRSPTPPSFWEADFPTTQEVAAQREMNEQRRRRKAVEMQEEASRQDGRYVKRVR